VRVLLVNRSPGPLDADLSVSGLSGMPGSWRATRYLFDRTRVAQFIGRKPGTTAEGRFEGFPGDVPSQLSLLPVEVITGSSTTGTVHSPLVRCPPISFTVLVFEPQT